MKKISFEKGMRSTMFNSYTWRIWFDTNKNTVFARSYFDWNLSSGSIEAEIYANDDVIELLSGYGSKSDRYSSIPNMTEIKSIAKTYQAENECTREGWRTLYPEFFITN